MICCGISLGGRSRTPLVAFTVCTAFVVGLFALCEATLYFGYILPNDAVITWPRGECKVNASSFELQQGRRCPAGASCYTVYRASGRVEELASKRQLLAFDTAFGDFSHSPTQAIRFLAKWNTTRLIARVVCHVNPEYDDPVCLDSSGRVAGSELQAVLHGGPCVGRIVLGHALTYTSDYTERGRVAHRLVWVVGFFMGPISVLLVYCACLGWSRRRRWLSGDKTTVLTNGTHTAASGGRSSIFGPAKAANPRVDDENWLLPGGTTPSHLEGVDGIRTAPSTPARNGQPEGLELMTPGSTIVDAHALLGPDAEHTNAEDASRALGKVGSHNWQVYGQDDSFTKWNEMLKAARLAQGDQDELANEHWREAASTPIRNRGSLVHFPVTPASSPSQLSQVASAGDLNREHDDHGSLPTGHLSTLRNTQSSE